ncbi:UvrD-helicase domain-containing protein [Thermostilla marina]
MVSKTGQMDNLVIRASAGTGKTYRLSNRFLRILADGHPPESILAATFTRAAAGEILDRVIRRLAEAAADADKAAELGEAIGVSLTETTCRALLRTVLAKLHRLQVSTLDSFAVRIAKAFELELGLPPGWQILDEVTLESLRYEAVARALAYDSPKNMAAWMGLLDKGKTKRGVARQLNELAKAIYERVFLRCAPDAWDVLQPRKALSQAEIDQALDSLQRLADTDLANKRLNTAIKKDIEKITAGDWARLLTTGLAPKILAGAGYFNKPIPDEVAVVYRPLIEHALALEINLVVSQNRATRELLARFDRAFREVKQDARGASFSDVTRMLAHALEQGQGFVSRDRVGYRLDGLVRHLLLDEFQDTSPEQWRVLRPFAERVCSTHDGKHSFFCVGDVKQAIYGWRGGVARIFDLIDKQLPGLAGESLEKSYRSARPIIELVNTVFGDLPGNRTIRQQIEGDTPDKAAAFQASVTAWHERFREHDTARDDLTGYWCLKTFPLPTDDETDVDVLIAATAREVAELREKAPSASIGVLMRANEHIPAICRRLRRLGIPTSQEGGTPLSESFAVRLILAALQLSEHPGDTAAAFLTAHSELASLLGLADYPTLTKSEQERRRNRVSFEIRRKIQRDGMGCTVRDWVTALAPHVDKGDQASLKRLLERAYRFDAEGGLHADDFLDQIDAEKIADPSAAVVRVMTIHNSKGLQFDAVILPDLDRSLLGRPDRVMYRENDDGSVVEVATRYVRSELQPHLPDKLRAAIRWKLAENITEALCVLYVAITRAIRSVTMLVRPTVVEDENGRIESIKQHGSASDSAAAILASALARDVPRTPDALLCEGGDPKWYGTLPPEQPPTDAPTAPAVVRLQPSRRVRELEGFSPSHLEGAGTKPLGAYIQAPAAGAADRGTLLHAWFEQVRFLDEGEPDESLLRQIGERLEFPAHEIDDILRQFRRMLAQPLIRRVLARETYRGKPPADRHESSAVHVTDAVRNPRWELRTESAFSVRVEDKLCRGSIDRLMILFDGDRRVAADIIDYKSDGVSPDSGDVFTDRVEFYRPQLEAYRKAAAAWLKLPEENVSIRLLFVGAPAIVRLD